MRTLADVHHMVYDYKRLELYGLYKGQLDVTNVPIHELEKVCRKHWLLDWDKAIKITLTKITVNGEMVNVSERIYLAK